MQGCFAPRGGARSLSALGECAGERGGERGGVRGRVGGRAGTRAHAPRTPRPLQPRRKRRGQGSSISRPAAPAEEGSAGSSSPTVGNAAFMLHSPTTGGGGSGALLLTPPVWWLGSPCKLPRALAGAPPPRDSQPGPEEAEGAAPAAGLEILPLPPLATPEEAAQRASDSRRSLGGLLGSRKRRRQREDLQPGGARAPLQLPRSLAGSPYWGGAPARARGSCSGCPAAAGLEILPLPPPLATLE